MRSLSSPVGSRGMIHPVRGSTGNSCRAPDHGDRRNSALRSLHWTGMSCPFSPASCPCSERPVDGRPRSHRRTHRALLRAFTRPHHPPRPPSLHMAPSPRRPVAPSPRPPSVTPPANAGRLPAHPHHHHRFAARVPGGVDPAAGEPAARCRAARDRAVRGPAHEEMRGGELPRPVRAYRLTAVQPGSVQHVQHVQHVPGARREPASAPAGPIFSSLPPTSPPPTPGPSR